MPEGPGYAGTMDVDLVGLDGVQSLEPGFHYTSQWLNPRTVQKHRFQESEANPMIPGGINTCSGYPGLNTSLPPVPPLMSAYTTDVDMACIDPQSETDSQMIMDFEAFLNQPTEDLGIQTVPDGVSGQMDDGWCPISLSVGPGGTLPFNGRIALYPYVNSDML